jgi:hypothetical protein
LKNAAPKPLGDLSSVARRAKEEGGLYRSLKKQRIFSKEKAGKPRLRAGFLDQAKKAP